MGASRAAGPFPNQTPPRASRRRMLIGVAITAGILVVVFGLILPQFIDYEAVVETFLELEAWQLGLLAVLAIATYMLQGLILRGTLPGLRIVEATLGMLASLSVKGTIPGPVDAALRYRLMVEYGYGVEASALSAATFKSLELVTRLLMPLAAVVILLADGQPIIGLELLALVAAILSITAVGSFIAVLRSERLARRIGDWVERTVVAIAVRFKRTPPANLSDRIVAMRATGQALVSARGLLGLGLSLVQQAANAVILTLALAFVGVDFDALPISVVWAIVALVYLLPLGPGFTELAYLALFSVAVGSGDPLMAPITAGVVIFRVFQWFIPIPIGYGLIAWWQRRDGFSLL